MEATLAADPHDRGLALIGHLAAMSTLAAANATPVGIATSQATTKRRRRAPTGPTSGNTALPGSLLAPRATESRPRSSQGVPE